MSGIRYSETLVLWDHGTGLIALHRLQGDGYEYFKDLRCSGGAACTGVRNMKGSKLAARMLLDMWTIVLRHGLDAEDVHRAFCHVEEYAYMMSDMVPDDLHQLRDDEAVLVFPGEGLAYFRLNAGNKERIHL